MLIDITIDNKKEKCFIFKNKASEKMNLCSIETTDISLSEEVNFSSIIKTDKTKDLFIKIVSSKHGHKTNKSKFFLREVISERLFFNVSLQLIVDCSCSSDTWSKSSLNFILRTSAFPTVMPVPDYLEFCLLKIPPLLEKLE